MRIISDTEENYLKKLSVGTVCGLGTALVTSPLGNNVARVTSTASMLLGFIFADEICDAAQFVGEKIAEKINKKDEKTLVTEYFYHDDENAINTDFSANTEA